MVLAVVHLGERALAVVNLGARSLAVEYLGERAIAVVHLGERALAVVHTGVSKSSKIKPKKPLTQFFTLITNLQSAYYLLLLKIS